MARFTASLQHSTATLSVFREIEHVATIWDEIIQVYLWLRNRDAKEGELSSQELQVKCAEVRDNLGPYSSDKFFELYFHNVVFNLALFRVHQVESSCLLTTSVMRSDDGRNKRIRTMLVTSTEFIMKELRSLSKLHPLTTEFRDKT